VTSAVPRLLSLATVVPPYALGQPEVTLRARHLFAQSAGADFERLMPVFAHAGIERRYSSVPIEWYERAHGWAERNALYLEHAVSLLNQAAGDALAFAELKPGAIDAVVVVSTTGVATPALDARLMEKLPLRADVTRLPIFGLGCAGGVLGLSRAADLARAAPESRVLLLVVELCALCFRKDDTAKSNIVATALFGDGAAAAVLSCRGDGPRLGAAGEHTWPQSLDIMGWDVAEDGLRAVFSRDIPALVRNHMREVAGDFLERHGFGLGDIDHFICHPGGAKVLTALEEAFGLDTGALVDARGVLRDFGNMSAATVLFVLERALRAGVSGRLLMTTLGPGFTAGFQLVDA
jgi:alkylresorcinol/alkylpyrone synthase